MSEAGGNAEQSCRIEDHSSSCDRRHPFVSHRNGYPDSTYFTRLSEVLSTHGIEEPPAKS